MPRRAGMCARRGGRQPEKPAPASAFRANCVCVPGKLLLAFCGRGGFHVQFNCISSDVLREAQRRPEEHRDLLVRVAGYSTQFVNLSRSMQDAIIARTEHSGF